MAGASVSSTCRTDDAPELETINGESIGFPGITLNIDSPFAVTDGVPLGATLEEASQLLNSAWSAVRRIAEDTGDDELRGSAFLINAADALITSLLRGFQKHPMSKGADGYHA